MTKYRSSQAQRKLKVKELLESYKHILPADTLTLTGLSTHRFESMEDVVSMAATVLQMHKHKVLILKSLYRRISKALFMVNIIV